MGFNAAGEDFGPATVMLSGGGGTVAPDQAGGKGPAGGASGKGVNAGDLVSWTTGSGKKASGKVVRVVTTGTLKPPVGPAIPAPAVLVQMGQMKLALPMSKVAKTTAASVALANSMLAPSDTPVEDRPFGGLAPTVTLHDVELCRAGTWQASTGTANISEADLQAVIAAAKDPEVDRAPVHPGHYDARFSNSHDGEPAIGFVRPTRLENGVLIGDLVDVPAKLAAVIPKAYPRRSVEMAYNVKTPGGKTYPAVITGLALLGVKTPAVKGLADVVARYSVGGQEYDVVEFAVGEELTPDTPDDTSASHHTASLSEHDQSQSVTDQQTTGGTVPRPTFTNDRVAQLLGLPADDPAIAKIQSALTTEDAPATTDAGAVAAGQGQDASADAGQGAPAGDPAPAAPAAPAAAPAAPAADAAPQAVAASQLQLPEGTVLLSQGQLDQLMSQAAAGASAAEVIAKQRRDGIIAAALSEGKITPAEAEGDPEKKLKGFRALLDEDEDRTVLTLSALASGRVPVTSQGHGSGNGPTPDEAATAEEDALYANFSSEVLGIETAVAQ